MNASRREFLGSATLAALGLSVGAGVAAQTPRPVLAPRLADRFPDLRRHFIFEYYPWYGSDPWRHWQEGGHEPPGTLATNYLPRLGAYDSTSRAVLEQHARWIAESGVGAIIVSWWGPRGSEIDRAIPALMDVMHAHDIHVSFHLESYTTRRALEYASDVEYLIKEYGDRRRWDALLLLTDEDGATGPVFKSFRTILPAEETDCHGVTAPVADYATDAVWRAQTDRVRATFKSDFDRVLLLADSLNMGRTAASGFDGIAIYDNFVEPATWATHARNCLSQNLLFSFNVNPGFDAVVPRRLEPGSCYVPSEFQPGGKRYDWSRASDREDAKAASLARIVESFRTTLALQTDARYTNQRRGFFLTYVNSFNEWHEGHQFEPMKDRRAFTSAEAAAGYHNPDDGAYRLNAVRSLLREVLD